MVSTDILIVGAGIAGAGLAAALADRRNVLLIEQEAWPGHHSTGRSAAIFIQNYGNAVIRALSAASRPLFEEPDPDLFAAPLLSQRGILYVAAEDELADHEALLGKSAGLVPMSADEAVGMVPLLDPARIAAAAYERDASDIDVNGLHQGWLKKAKSAGAALRVDAALLGARRIGGKWQVETSQGSVEANVIVNAAGAWADTVAQACGLSPVGLTPMRRSIAVLPWPEGYERAHWPLVASSGDRWYFKADAGRLLVSPADEDPVEPHDAFVDDMVLAEGLDRYQQAVRAEVTHVEANWAGLRTFAPDRTPVVGFDQAGEGFFWLAGQGGYGIQTSPALSMVAAALLLKEAPPLGIDPFAMSPNRRTLRASDGSD